MTRVSVPNTVSCSNSESLLYLRHTPIKERVLIITYIGARTNKTPSKYHRIRQLAYNISDDPLGIVVRSLLSPTNESIYLLPRDTTMRLKTMHKPTLLKQATSSHYTPAPTRTTPHPNNMEHTSLVADCRPDGDTVVPPSADSVTKCDPHVGKAAPPAPHLVVPSKPRVDKVALPSTDLITKCGPRVGKAAPPAPQLVVHRTPRVEKAAVPSSELLTKCEPRVGKAAPPAPQLVVHRTPRAEKVPPADCVTKSGPRVGKAAPPAPQLVVHRTPGVDKVAPPSADCVTKSGPRVGKVAPPAPQLVVHKEIRNQLCDGGIEESYKSSGGNNPIVAASDQANRMPNEIIEPESAVTTTSYTSTSRTLERADTRETYFSEEGNHRDDRSGGGSKFDYI